MADQPSWKSSTLSQLASLSMVSYLVGCFMLIAGGGCYRKEDVVLTGYNGLRWAVEALVIGYLARRQVQKPNGEEGKPNGTSGPV